MHRRNFFKNSTVAGLGLATTTFGGTSLLESFTKKKIRNYYENDYPVIRPQIMAPKGAIYIPARAYNTWQQWKNYDQEETVRDFGYATSIGLNSLRIWLSYEYWLEDAKRHEDSLEQMLDAADKKGLKILLALFDSCGVENTSKAREDRNFHTAVAVKSPSLEISRDKSRWNEPEKFVNRMMERFGSDNRLLAIEVMNEPGFANGRMAMSRFLFKAAKAKQGSIPLTIGSLRGMENWGNFMDLGIDLFEYHDNFPTHANDFNRELKMAKEVAETLGRPLWITEWQRLRPNGNGWNEQKLPETELGPDFASLADIVRGAGIGNYFWSLMLKPAYLVPQRNIGTFNGLFFEDGAVYSLADARAISANPDFKAEERKQLPGWWK